MRGMGRLRRGLRRFQSSSVILCYHRVTELGSDPQLLSISPKNFAQHLEVLRSHYHVIRLREWALDCHSSWGFGHYVVVTFDDGYSDNYHQALPLLRAADCPATVFVTAGKIGDNREFWWDELERLILLPSRVPNKLSLTIGHQNYSWRLQSETDLDQNNDGWHVLQNQNPTSRQAVYLDLCRLLRNMIGIERLRILEELCRWAGLEDAGRSSHRPLSRSELCALASHELIEIGAHTVTHPSLAGLPPSDQKFEIHESKTILENLTGRSVRSFSYPFGGQVDYNEGTIRVVRDAFDYACANFPESEDYVRDRYQMPRFLVRNWDGDHFAGQLASWASRQG